MGEIPTLFLEKCERDAHSLVVMGTVPLQKLCYGYCTITEAVLLVLGHRVANPHRMPYLYRLFAAKEPLITGLFCGK